jgi:hypothetical protein
MSPFFLIEKTRVSSNLILANKKSFLMDSADREKNPLKDKSMSRLLPIGHNTSSLLLMKNNTRFLKRKKTLK